MLPQSVQSSSISQKPLYTPRLAKVAKENVWIQREKERGTKKKLAMRQKIKSRSHITSVFKLPTRRVSSLLAREPVRRFTSKERRGKFKNRRFSRIWYPVVCRASPPPLLLLRARPFLYPSPASNVGFLDLSIQISRIRPSVAAFCEKGWDMVTMRYRREDISLA